MNDAQHLLERLDRLESAEAIRRLKAAYCAGCDDDHNPDTLTDLFWPDAVWEAAGIAHCEGETAIRAFFQQMRDGGTMRNSAHHAINPDIEVDGDTASGHWRLLMLWTGNAVGGDVQYQRIIGWYRERYERRNGIWKFKQLYCEVEESGPYTVEPSRMPGA
ncbi:MAG: nuclear transport factor 2 family protein [Pseudomonadota bacterium]